MSKYYNKRRRLAARQLEKAESEKRFFNAAMDKTAMTERLYTVEDLYTNLLNVIQNPSKLIKSEGYDVVFDTVRSDITVRGAVNTIFEGIGKFEWEIVTNDASEKEVDIAYTTLEKLFMNNLQKQILWAAFYGFQPLNVVWKKDNLLLIDRVLEMPHNSIVIDPERTVKYVSDYNKFEGVVPPPYTLLMPTYDSNHRNPYGEGLFLNCFKSVFIKRSVLDFWTYFAEDYGSPGITAKFEMSAASAMQKTPEEFVNYFNEQLTAMRGKRIIVHPSGTEVTPLASGAVTSSEIYHGLIKFCKDEITGLILGHEAASSATPGKLGNDTSAVVTKTDRIESYTKFLTSYVNELLKWQHEINFPGGNACQVRFFERDDISIYKQKAEYAQLLVNQGVKLNEDYYSDELNLDKKYFKIVEPPKPNDNTKTAAVKNFKNLLSMLPAKVQNATDADTKTAEEQTAVIEAFTEYILETDIFKDLKIDVLDTITSELKKYDSFEAMQKNVYDIFDKLDIKNKQEFVSKFMLITAIYGYNSEAV